MNELDFSGKIAFVTGAAAGIGAAIGRSLANRGASVYGADLTWAGETGGIEQVTLDVRDRDAVRRAIGDVASAAGGLDVAVNCAGTMRAKTFFEYDDDDWDFILDVNARGLFFCIQGAASVMKELGRGGAIVNISSIAGRNGRTMSPPYGASKAAVINLTRSAALELAADGIRVNAVCPGIIDTEFNLRLGRQFGPAQGLTPEEFVARRVDIVPLARIGTPEDVARAVCFLASPLADYVTGQTLNVDGGVVMD